MKQLVCEMCGGTDLIKDGGVFVCQTCGCKYTIEEAKKMMVEGTVDVSGSTVKVDTSDELANLYQIARRAKDDNNSENAAKYYDLILIKDPFSWEAAFYVVYFKAMECKIAQIRNAAISVSNCEDSVLSLVRDHVPEDEQESAVKEIMIRSALIANILESGAKSHYDSISQDIKSNYTQEYVDNSCAARDIAYNCGIQIEKIFGGKPDISKLAAEAWKAGIAIHTRLLPFFQDASSNKKVILSYARKIEKYDPAFAKPYIDNDRKETLEAEIAGLKKTIDSTPTEKEFKPGCLGGFFLACGIFMMIAGLLLTFSPDGEPSFAWMLVVGVIEIAVGYLAGRPPKAEVLEANKKRIAEVKATLAEKEKELSTLK